MLLSLILSAGLLFEVPSAGTEIPVSDSLHAVTVTADKGVVVSRRDTLSLNHSFSVSDILQHSTSLHVGDNGGAAGLKTVSLRGMGSAHTAIYVDGVRVGNVQSGQSDIGMLDTWNFSTAVVDYAQNSISFNTARPCFDKSPVSVRAALQAGSFDTYIPRLRLDFRLSDDISLSANVSGVLSEGDYRYSDEACRTNNDLKQIRAGLDLFGAVRGGDYHLKAYYNGSERGTPGSVSYPTEDRQKDHNMFLQGTLGRQVSSLYAIRLSAKASYDDIEYASSWGDSRYGQTEIQLNSAHDFRVKDWWKMSLAADLQWDHIESTNYLASRLTALGALASSFRLQRFSADLALEYMGIIDREGLARGAFSPSADIRYAVSKGMNIVAFARRAYRMPTFNELYYVGYGNPGLRPEDAWMLNLGVDFNRRMTSCWTVKAKLDCFCNYLTDKIISAPTEDNPNIWLPYNIGKVRSAGADVIAGADYCSEELRAAFETKYTWQSAVDITPGSASYGNAVPYIARHTIVLSGSLSWKGWSLYPVWQLRSGRSDGYGPLKDWNTLDLSIGKTLSSAEAGNMELNVSLRNILDCRYETVSGYPMPGRSIICGISYSF